jgi:hypothetical protein
LLGDNKRRINKLELDTMMKTWVFTAGTTVQRTATGHATRNIIMKYSLGDPSQWKKIPARSSDRADRQAKEGSWTAAARPVGDLI